MRKDYKRNPVIVSDEQMIKSGAWIVRHLKRKAFAESVFLTYLCGYFHTYPKQARGILENMAANGFVTKEGETVTWKGG